MRGDWRALQPDREHCVWENNLLYICRHMVGWSCCFFSRVRATSYVLMVQPKAVPRFRSRIKTQVWRVCVCRGASFWGGRAEGEVIRNEYQENPRPPVENLLLMRAVERLPDEEAYARLHHDQFDQTAKKNKERYMCSTEPRCSCPLLGEMCTRSEALQRLPASSTGSYSVVQRFAFSNARYFF